jgi:parvulin-like peptidyl-prolyl isomerase
MTLRARPVTRRRGRAGWDPGDRRNTLINAGFAGAIVVSILILLGYAGWTWYDSHFGMAASVDGTVITRDDVRTRLAIEKFRIDYTDAQIRKLLADGKVSKAIADQQLSFLDQRRQSLDAITLEKLIDVTLQAKLAVEEGVAATDADLDAQLTKEKTVQEERHVWMIEIAPVPNATTGEVGDTEKAAAKAKAEAALSDLKGGKAWADVATTVSTATSAPQSGDLGWLPQDSGYDEPFMAAVFAAEKDAPTDVVEGIDGTFRIGRVTEVAPPTVDQAFETKLEAAGIKLADYLVAVRGDVIRTKLSDKIVADLSAPSPQRHVLQIKLKAIQPAEGGVKVRHILFAPKDDPAGAATLPDTDPAWAAAKAEADAAYQTLLQDPTKFDQMARTMSDETAAKDTGGKLDFISKSSDDIDLAFRGEITKDGLKPGDLIPPFKSKFGWHVVQFMRPYGDGNEAWLEEIRKQAVDGADFAQLARDQGEGDEAGKGGDIGWIAKGQLDDAREAPIFDTDVGSISTVVDIPDDGDYLFKVLAEETRPASPEQIAAFKESGFTNWYSLKKAEAKIDRSGSSSSVTS